VTSDNRITTGLTCNITDTPERHGYCRGDDQHADRVIGIMAGLARIWEDTQDYPADAHAITVPSPRLAYPGPSSQADHDVSTVLAALEIAADCHRGEAGLCTGCPDKSCPACQSRLRDAQTSDCLATQVLREAQAGPVARRQPGPDGPPAPPRRPERAAGWEASQ
jgi:hypothetical protein